MVLYNCPKGSAVTFSSLAWKLPKCLLHIKIWHLFCCFVSQYYLRIPLDWVDGTIKKNIWQTSRINQNRWTSTQRREWQKLEFLTELYLWGTALQYIPTIIWSMSLACQERTGACQDAPEGDAGRSRRQRHLGFSAWPTDVAICSDSLLRRRRTSSPVWNLKDVFGSPRVDFDIAQNCKHK